MIKTSFYFCFFFILWGCSFVDEKLVVVNFSNKKLILVSDDSNSDFKKNNKEYYENKKHDSDFYTPEGIEIYLREDIYCKSCDHILNPYNADRLSSYHFDWEYIVKTNFNKKLNLFVFDIDSVLKYKDLNIAYQKKAYYKIVRLSLDELISNDWIVEIR